MWLLLTIVVLALLVTIGWAVYRRRHPRLGRRHRIDIPDRMPPRGYWPGHNG
jgi:hypothetical protein